MPMRTHLSTHLLLPLLGGVMQLRLVDGEWGGRMDRMDSPPPRLSSRFPPPPSRAHLAALLQSPHYLALVGVLGVCARSSIGHSIPPFHTPRIKTSRRQCWLRSRGNEICPTPTSNPRGGSSSPSACIPTNKQITIESDGWMDGDGCWRR